MNNNFAVNTAKLLYKNLATQLKKEKIYEIRMKKFRCPYCNGRLFDFIRFKDEIGLAMHDCQLIIKCWKCHANVTITYDDLV